jgi:hypothetical protein
LELSEDGRFHSLLRISDRSKSGLYKEMRDAEFVLRFFAFRETWGTFSGGMMRHMDRFMRDNQNIDEVAIEGLHNDFVSTLEAVRAAFGEQAFRRWEPARGAWRRQVLAALYDAQMFACRGLDPLLLEERREPILGALQALFDDVDFQRSISAATNTPRLFNSRIERVRRLLDESLR